MSQRPEDVVMPFGQYIGDTLSDILQGDPRYLDWLGTLALKSLVLREAVKAMNEKYEANIAKAFESIAPSIRAKVYTVAKQGSQWVLTKEHGQRFRMGEVEEEALDKAYFTAEAEYASLVIKRG